MSLSLTQKTATSANWRTQYDYLRAYYLNNGLYDQLRAGVGYGYDEQIKSLRNPAFRVVEFYAAKTWPGPLPSSLPILADRPIIIPAIEQIWAWSNFGAQKQDIARSFPQYGDMFLKVATRADERGFVNRVFIQNLQPQTVTDFSADERDYVTYFRTDTPQVQRNPITGEDEPYTITEIWDKAAMSFRLWRHDHGVDVATNQLGDQDELHDIREFGIDFPPIVWQPFHHIGGGRGMAAITPALDKIDEANRQATQLHRILFRNNRALWASTGGGRDANNRPVAALDIGSTRTLAMSNGADEADIINLPGDYTLTPLIPNINYSAALSILQDQMIEIRQDLPEMIYSQLQDQTQLSGVAIRYLMEAAIDRLLEARGNAETALRRAHEIALTMGANVGLDKFRGIGNYLNGDFEHSFMERPVLTPAELERAQIMQTYTSAGVPLDTAAARAGWSQDERDEMSAAVDKASAAANAGIAAALLNAQEAQDAGNGGGSFTDEAMQGDEAMQTEGAQFGN